MKDFIVDTVIEDVRSQIDEQNTANTDDERDILPALNRAQKKIAQVLSKHYSSPLLTNKMVTLTGGVGAYKMPSDAFSKSVTLIEVMVNGIFHEVQEISYRDAGSFELKNSINIPFYWYTMGADYNLIPKPTGTYPIRLWYLRSPETLVKSQGRITVVNPNNNYLIVDSIGSDLTTEATDLNNYVNIWDRGNGVLKATLQIQSIAGNKITFKTIPDRTTVLGKEVSTSLPAGVSLDDYVSVVSGTCVPFIQDPWFNYVVQYAVASLTRRAGGPADAEESILKELEKQVETSWSGRGNTRRVKKRNKNYFNVSRRGQYGS